uniref:Protein-lysine N-trimethyltransferase SMYD5 n=1 Tax=Tabanus bromius TaxID=304241 RepID=A0A0K8TT51_TABBR
MEGFEIMDLPEKGRSMIARKHFKTGEVIFEEEPFVSCQFSWNTAYGYAACNHCMRPLETTEQNVRRLANDPTIRLPFPEHCPTKEWVSQMVTCSRCGVSYCSEDCRHEALQKYHKVACMGVFQDDMTHPINILNEKWKHMHYPRETGTIMLIVRLLAMYKQSIDKEEFLKTLKSFQSIVFNEELSIFHKMLGTNFENQLQELYSAYVSAFASEELSMFLDVDTFKSLMGLIGTNSQGIATSPLSQWVKKVSELDLPSEQKIQLDKYIDDLYYKIDQFAGDFLNTEGSGLYILQSKINHSCVPNAESSFPYSNDILVLKALRNILPGEEICVSYLDECQLSRSRHSRQKELRENYLFICKCPKCESQINDLDETSEEEEEDDVDMEDDE